MLVGRQKRLNLTKTVRKVPITEDLSRSGFHVEDKGDQRVQPKYDTEHPVSLLRGVGRRFLAAQG